MHAAGEPVQDLLAKLQGQAKERMLRAYAPKSKGTLASAIRKFARFAQHVEARVLFQMSAVTGDRGAAVHNEWTLVLFVEWLLRAISEKTGKPVKVSTIETYVSLLKGYFIFTYDFEMPVSTPRLTRMIALIKSDDPLGGQRSKRHGFRRRHLKALWKKGGPLCGAGADACTKLAALGTAWHCFARGGELCTSAGFAGPTRADLQFRTLKDGTRFAIMHLRPLKKRGAAACAKVPQYISEADGGGADVYMLLKRMVDADPVSASAAASTPLFRVMAKTGKTRRSITVAQLRKFVRDCAGAIGYGDRRLWGAHSGRIGGATDLASTGKASELLLKAKGRWASDIGKIYARMTRRSQLAASRLMHEARGRDLEEIHPGFTQGV